jgi:hypothetical protein
VFGAILIALWGAAPAGMLVPQRARGNGGDAATGAAMGNGTAR